MRRRLGRLGSGVALTTLAALALAGCTPPEPTEEELLAEAIASYEGFYAAIDDQMAAGTADPSAFSDFATTSVADEWAGYVQSSIDGGTISSGVPTVVDIAIDSASATEVSARLCSDGRSIETTHADGSTQAPSALTAWQISYVRDESDAPLLISALAPSQDQRICE